MIFFSAVEYNPMLHTDKESAALSLAWPEELKNTGFWHLSYTVYQWKPITFYHKASPYSLFGLDFLRSYGPQLSSSKYLWNLWHVAETWLASVGMATWVQIGHWRINLNIMVSHLIFASLEACCKIRTH